MLDAWATSMQDARPSLDWRSKTKLKPLLAWVPVKPSRQRSTVAPGPIPRLTTAAPPSTRSCSRPHARQRIAMLMTTRLAPLRVRPVPSTLSHFAPVLPLPRLPILGQDCLAILFTTNFCFLGLFNSWLIHDLFHCYHIFEQWLVLNLWLHCGFQCNSNH